ncbi:hypothetical protein D3C72_1764330 [compost metagenome]
MPRSSAISAGVARGAARRAAKHSSSSRMLRSSCNCATVSSGTLTDLPGLSAKARSDTSCSSASRTGVWLTPNVSVIERSVMVSPGRNSPIMIFCLISR